MGLAVTIMHYLGMLSTSYYEKGGGHTSTNHNAQVVMSIALASGLALCTLTMIDVVDYLRAKGDITRKVSGELG